MGKHFRLEATAVRTSILVACMGLAQAVAASHCVAQDYVAHYSATYRDATPATFYKVEQKYYNYLVTHGNPPWAANISGYLSYLKSNPNPAPLSYQVLVGRSDNDILCVIDAPSDKMHEVMLYNASLDCTYFLQRHPGSIGYVSIDRGLNTWPLSFVPLTGLGSPFLKSSPNGDYAYPFPLKAAPPRSIPGAYTTLIYVNAKLKRSPDGAKLTSTDAKSGCTTFVWSFSNRASAGGAEQSIAAGTIKRYDYQEQPIPPFDLKQQKYIGVPQGLLTAHLDSFNETKIDPTLFQIAHWLKQSDEITDNRHASRTVAYYEASYGDVDHQLYRPTQLLGTQPVRRTSPSSAGIVVAIMGLVLTLVWMLYKFRRNQH